MSQSPRNVIVEDLSYLIDMTKLKIHKALHEQSKQFAKFGNHPDALLMRKDAINQITQLISQWEEFFKP